jgi:DNA-binding MarR family transcriptional regulator
MPDTLPDPATARAMATAANLRVLVGALRRRMRGEGHLGDLTFSQSSVLLHLEREGPTTVTALAKLEGVRPQSMGATVAVLQAAGWVEGAPHPTDGRQTLLSLTQACRERVAAGRAAREDWLLKAMRSQLTAAEQDELARAVALLKRLAEA